MDEIIMNERFWVEDAISSLNLGKNPTETINRLAKYYRKQGFKKRDIRGKIEIFLIRCDPGIDLCEWEEVIDDAIRWSESHDLIEIEHIVITEAELDSIAKCESKLERKLLFTLLCLAKYANAVNPKNGNWVNIPRRDIFTLANIVIVVKKQLLLLSDLRESGCTSHSKIIDNVSVNVSIVDNDSPPAMYVTDFRNLGNQYAMHVDSAGYVTCKQCGIVVKRRSNRQQYCTRCSADLKVSESANKGNVA